MTHTLPVTLGERSYPVHVGPALLSQPELLLPYLQHPRVAVISNDTIFPLLGTRLVQVVERAGVKTVPIVLPDGEQFKTWETLSSIFDVLLEHAFDRKCTLIALGGGVIGDLTGFAAATYQRGVPFIQIPTTLLAQVDSSIGGKTAINHPRGKNMIGAFYQPRAVLADTDTLKTLPDRELRAGLAEVVKYGLIRDFDFFVWLEANMGALLGRDPEALTYAILRSCKNKAQVVAADERESGERALLNLGHTFGHAIEAALGYGKWLHGEAVAVGMAMAARLSHQRGHFSAGELGRTEALLQSAGLPIEPPAIPSAHLMELMQRDKKNEAGRMRLILLKSIGHAYIETGMERRTLEQFLGGPD